MTKQDELKIREMIQKELARFEKDVKKEVKSEIKKTSESNKKQMNANVKNLENKLTKELDILQKKGLDKNKIIDLLSKAFKQQNKFMWEKSDFITQYLKTI